MDDTKVDLTFVTKKQLIDELAKRHDAIVVLGLRFESQIKYTVTRYHAGNRHVCLGLISNESSIINNIENSQLNKDMEND